jgi:FimV-like protein
VLSLPTAGEVAISSVEARDEVARQNAEWSAPAPLETPGLKLVADPVAVADEALPKATVETAVSSVALEEEARAAAVSDDRSPVVPDTSVSPEFSALLSKVEALESNLRRMEEQLVQRDLELEALRVQLLAATAKLEAPVVASSLAGQSGSTERSLLWLLMGALGLAMSGGAALLWWQRGRFASHPEGSYTAQPAAQLGEEVKSTEAVAAAPDDHPVSSKTALPEGPIIRDAESASTNRDRSTADEGSETLMSNTHPDPLRREEATETSAIESAAGHGQAASGLSLVPVPDDAVTDSSDDARGMDAPAAEESIYGLETDPIDSKLDLARAYLDMGDEAGARAVLAEVVKEGNLSQQAEAGELLSRFEMS